MPRFNDDKGKNRKANIQHQRRVVALFDALGLACAKILGNKRRNRIADGHKNQRKDVLYPHRCRISGKRLRAERVDHRLHDHHTDGHGGLLQDRRHGDAQHRAQHPPVKPLKGALVAPHPVQEDQQRKHGGNALGDQGRQRCTEHAQPQPGDHPEVHKNIENRRENQQPQRNFGLPDGGEHRGEDVVHKQKRKAHKIHPQIQHGIR